MILNKIAADTATVQGLGAINDADPKGTLIINALIILGRIVLEFLMLRKEKRKREKEQKEN